MSRVIKFRAWDGSRMIYESRHKPYDHYHMLTLEGDFLGHTRAGDMDFDYEKDPLNACEYVLMQYIGLPDKNEKEAYEDDLAEVVINPTRYGPVTAGRRFKLVGRIAFDALTARWIICFPDNEINLISQEFGWADHEFEIIGNIHEHPHLLKQNQ